MYDTPRYKDDAEERRQLEARQKQIQEYRLFRERVEKWREEDRVDRNKLKIQQIEECERLQVMSATMVSQHIKCSDIKPEGNL